MSLKHIKVFLFVLFLSAATIVSPWLVELRVLSAPSWSDAETYAPWYPVMKQTCPSREVMLSVQEISVMVITDFLTLDWILYTAHLVSTIFSWTAGPRHVFHRFTASRHFVFMRLFVFRFLDP